MKKVIEGWSFPIEVDSKTGKIKTTNNNDVIKQSVNMILKTQIMERKIFSNYGSELKSFMFGIVDSNYISSFKKNVRESIKRWEPHVVDIKVDARANSGPVSKIEADVEYVTDILPVVEKSKTSISLE